MSYQVLATKPFFQMAVFTALSVVLLLLLRPKNVNAVYNTTGVIYAIFILVNSIVVVFAARHWPYFFSSILFSVLYVVTVSFLAPLYIRLARLDGSGESGMIFLVIIYHPFALLLVIFLKWAYFKIV